jgi:hypothetical protein
VRQDGWYDFNPLKSVQTYFVSSMIYTGECSINTLEDVYIAFDGMLCICLLGPFGLK